MANWREHFEKLRNWIDSVEKDKITENVIKAHQNKSDSEILLQKLLISIETLLRQEIIRIPDTNKAYIPEKFLVYISEEENKSLRDDKRRFFEQNLGEMILERAKELAGGLELTSNKLIIEIFVNALLENKEIEVKISSDNDVNKSKTIQFVQKEEKSKLNKSLEFSNIENKTIDEAGTIDDYDSTVGILFRVEIWQTGKKLNEIPVVQKKITIGRDDSEKIANIRLPTDNRKISRTHAEINLDSNGEIWIVSLHKNPIIVSGKAYRNNEWAKLEAGNEIQIYDFTIKIKFAHS